ncbi:MAG: rod shape-determining protein RodA [Phycisphaerae bacterium]|nr:rod shape-determining protein RodA [Phycisphaerae bacterium]
MLNWIVQGRLGGLRLIMVAAVLALAGIGLVTIAPFGSEGGYIARQLFWITLGLASLFAMNLFHYKHLGRISYWLYLFTLLLLVFILIGKYVFPTSLVPPPEVTGRGAFRWIRIGPVNLQPSEFAKISYIIGLAWYLRHRENYRTVSGLIPPFLLSLLPMMLIILEPDLGTVMLFFPILFSVLFVAGAKKSHLATIMAIGLLLSPVFYMTLKPYQKERIVGFVKQNTDDTAWKQSEGFQLHRSKTCLGSGGFWGQGVEGIFIQYRFLPDRHNDFIFALIGHRWGFAGCMVVIFLYVVLITCGIEIAANQPDPFGRLLAAQMFINMGMTTGIMPVTGMTLPFVSYGGSSLLCNFIALGLLTNIARNRPHQLTKPAFEFFD